MLAKGGSSHTQRCQNKQWHLERFGRKFQRHEIVAFSMTKDTAPHVSSNRDHSSTHPPGLTLPQITYTASSFLDNPACSSIKAVYTHTHMFTQALLYIHTHIYVSRVYKLYIYMYALYKSIYMHIYTYSICNWYDSLIIKVKLVRKRISLNFPTVKVQNASKIKIIFIPNDHESPFPGAQAVGASYAVMLPCPSVWRGEAWGSSDGQRKLLPNEDHQTGYGKSNRKWFQCLGHFKLDRTC